MRDEWAEHFAAKARAFWTPEATQALTGGKSVPVLPGEAPVLLRALGLLHRDGSMPAREVRKYRQINHMVLTLRPALDELFERTGRLDLVDLGCGRAYLTALLAHCGTRVWRRPTRILGIDRNEALIDECRRRATQAGLDDVLSYSAAPIAEAPLSDAWRAAFGDEGAPTAVVALHACDTATDDAIASAVAAGAAFIAVAPCCQAELSRAWSQAEAAGAWSPLWESGHLRRHAAATMTDTLRAQLLRAAGYEVTAIEFVPSEHTPKNTLIRAMKRTDWSEDAWRAYEELEAASGGAPITLTSSIRARRP